MKLELFLLLATAVSPMKKYSLPSDLIPPAPKKCQVENVKPGCITVVEPFAPIEYYKPDNSFIVFRSGNEMPQILYISGEEWHVIEVSTSDLPTNKKNYTVLARTYCDEHVIRYKSLEPVSVLKVAILHEIFHAGTCTHTPKWWNSEDDTDDGHPGIYRLGPFMYSLLRDNPALATWIATNN
jgi:hypothetical protein